MAAAIKEKKQTVSKPTQATQQESSLDKLDTLITTVRQAQKRYARFSQQQVDHIFREAAMAANTQRIPLAKMAAQETRMGIAEDKVMKNHFASEFIYNKFKATPTCDIIERDDGFGILKIAEPIGVLAGVVPTTNPTSTAIFKALLASKTRNGIVFSPHPSTHHNQKLDT